MAAQADVWRREITFTKEMQKTQTPVTIATVHIPSVQIKAKHVDITSISESDFTLEMKETKNIYFTIGLKEIDSILRER